jgi:hypothetical protein
MNIARRRYLLIFLCVIVFILAFVGWSIHKKVTVPSYEQTTTNKDTGQTIINLPNQQPEKGGGNEYVTVLGDGPFFTAGMTQAQVTLAEQLITSYVNTQLHRDYTQVAILRSNFVGTGNLITAQMRLGSGSVVLNIKIGYHDLTYVSVTISNPNGNSMYTYSSGDVSVTVENASNPT